MSTPTEIVLPLEPGDRLTREEFERRYRAMPEVKKAELIEGVVYMPSPVRLRRHGRPHGSLIGWLAIFQAATPGVELGDNTTLRLDPTNEPQPDGLLLIDPAKGGQAVVTADDYVVGGPELLAEISASSASYDLNTKLRVYERHRVREYIVWRILDKALDWFVLRGDRFESMPLGADQIYRSDVFPGLWLDASAVLRDDWQTVYEVVRQGTGSPEHAAFVARLGRR